MPLRADRGSGLPPTGRRTSVVRVRASRNADASAALTFSKTSGDSGAKPVVSLQLSDVRAFVLLAFSTQL